LSPRVEVRKPLDEVHAALLRDNGDLIRAIQFPIPNGCVVFTEVDGLTTQTEGQLLAQMIDRSHQVANVLRRAGVTVDVLARYAA
jgi:hypothetical protein